MSSGYTRKYREIYKQIRENRNARDIFDYLCYKAAFTPYEKEVKNATYKLEIGELIASPSIISEQTSWKENRKKISYTEQEVKSALKFLEKIGAIKTVVLPIKTHGSKITVFCYTAEGQVYYNNQQQPEPALEPEDFEAPLQPENSEPQPERQPERQPEPALQLQGMKQGKQPEPQPEPQPAIINNNSFNNSFNNKDLKEAAKIADANSIVNTYSQIFTYFFAKVSKKITPAQEGFLSMFIDEGMQPELLMAIMDRAGENSDQSAPAYVIKTCRNLLKDNVLTLDKWQRNATEYKQLKKTGTESSSTPRDKSGVLDNLGF